MGEMTQERAQLEEARREIEKLKAERDLWQARAFAMFWRLPGDTLIGDLQRDTEKARAFLPR